MDEHKSRSPRRREIVNSCSLCPFVCCRRAGEKQTAASSPVTGNTAEAGYVESAVCPISKGRQQAIGVKCVVSGRVKGNIYILKIAPFRVIAPFPLHHHVYVARSASLSVPVQMAAEYPHSAR